MKQTLTFIPPVVDSTQSSIHTEAYEKSVDLYNQGEYLQAFHSLLDYLNATSGRSMAIRMVLNFIFHTVLSWCISL